MFEPVAFCLKPCRWGEELAVDELDQVVAGKGGGVVNLTVLVLGHSPGFPTVGFVEDVGVGLAIQGSGCRAVRLQRVEVFQEEQPGCLFRMIQFTGAPSILREHVVDILKCLLKHGFPYSYRHCWYVVSYLLTGGCFLRQ